MYNMPNLTGNKHHRSTDDDLHKNLDASTDDYLDAMGYDPQTEINEYTSQPADTPTNPSPNPPEHTDKIYSRL